MSELTNILVVASTFPARESDPVPAFVRDQVIALKTAYPELNISVLAPHDARSHTQSFTHHEQYDEYRFHYFWPFRAEKLAGRGIMPALKANPLNYLLIPFLFLGEFIALYRVTRKLKPDVLYAHWFTPQAVIARLVGALTGVPFVFTTHASDVDVWHKIPGIGKLIVRNNAKKARAITAVSRRSMAKLERFFTAQDWQEIQKCTEIIPMGVNLPEQTSSVTTLPGTILFVGRLAEKKGVQYLLPAFAELHKVSPKTRLIIAGDGPWRSKLTEQATQLGISDAVTFPGYMTGAAKADLIQSADIYVVPSIVTKSGDAEGLPVSLMEGLAYGKLCIATDVSGADDVLTHGIDGFLIPEKDTSALTAALESALNLPLEQKTAIKRQAQETAAQFAWSVIAKRHFEFFTRHLR